MKIRLLGLVGIFFLLASLCQASSIDTQLFDHLISRESNGEKRGPRTRYRRFHGMAQDDVRLLMVYLKQYSPYFNKYYHNLLKKRLTKLNYHVGGQDEDDESKGIVKLSQARFFKDEYLNLDFIKREFQLEKEVFSIKKNACELETMKKRFKRYLKGAFVEFMFRELKSAGIVVVSNSFCEAHILKEVKVELSKLFGNEKLATKTDKFIKKRLKQLFPFRFFHLKIQKAILMFLRYHDNQFFDYVAFLSKKGLDVDPELAKKKKEKVTLSSCEYQKLMDYIQGSWIDPDNSPGQLVLRIQSVLEELKESDVIEVADQRPCIKRIDNHFRDMYAYYNVLKSRGEKKLRKATAQFNQTMIAHWKKFNEDLVPSVNFYEKTPKYKNCLTDWNEGTDLDLFAKAINFFCQSSLSHWGRSFNNRIETDLEDDLIDWYYKFQDPQWSAIYKQLLGTDDVFTIVKKPHFKMSKCKFDSLNRGLIEAGFPEVSTIALKAKAIELDSNTCLDIINKKLVKSLLVFHMFDQDRIEEEAGEKILDEIVERGADILMKYMGKKQVNILAYYLKYYSRYWSKVFQDRHERYIKQHKTKTRFVDFDRDLVFKLSECEKKEFFETLAKYVSPNIAEDVKTVLTDDSRLQITSDRDCPHHRQAYYLQNQQPPKYNPVVTALLSNFEECTSIMDRTRRILQEHIGWKDLYYMLLVEIDIRSPKDYAEYVETIMKFVDQMYRTKISSAQFCSNMIKGSPEVKASLERKVPKLNKDDLLRSQQNEITSLNDEISRMTGKLQRQAEEQKKLMAEIQEMKKIPQVIEQDKKVQELKAELKKKDEFIQNFKSSVTDLAKGLKKGL